jgi:hypothetical protein
VAFNKRQFAGLRPGRLLRYRRLPSGEGFVAEAGSREEIARAATPDDPCCEWDWDEAAQAWYCIAWC